MAWFLSRNYWSSIDHGLMASIGEKAISILAGNLNSGRSYLITAVIRKLEKLHCQARGRIDVRKIVRKRRFVHI